MSFRDDIIAGINDQLAEAGEDLSLTRDGQSVAVTGFHGNPERSSDQGEAFTGLKETSFVLLASEYQPTGVVTEPRLGDRITRSSGQVFEVLRPTSGLSHCEDYGGAGYAWRVQVGRIAE